MHGISSACGKLGAILGTYGIVYVARSSVRAVFFVSGGTLVRFGVCHLTAAGIAVAGGLLTLILPETSGKTLEELVAMKLNRLSSIGGYKQNSQTRLSTTYEKTPVPVR